MEIILDFKEGEMIYFLSHNGYQIIEWEYVQTSNIRGVEDVRMKVKFAIPSNNIPPYMGNNPHIPAHRFLSNYKDIDYLQAITHEFQLNNVFKKAFKHKLLNL